MSSDIQCHFGVKSWDGIGAILPFEAYFRAAKEYTLSSHMIAFNKSASQEKDVRFTAARPKQTTKHDQVVGERVKAIRKVRKLSQTALAEAIGVTFQQAQKYEGGKNGIGAGRLRVIAEFLEVPVSIFFDDSGASLEKPE